MSHDRRFEKRFVKNIVMNLNKPQAAIKEQAPKKIIVSAGQDRVRQNDGDDRKIESYYARQKHSLMIVEEEEKEPLWSYRWAVEN